MQLHNETSPGFRRPHLQRMCRRGAAGLSKAEAGPVEIALGWLLGLHSETSIFTLITRLRSTHMLTSEFSFTFLISET